MLEHSTRAWGSPSRYIQGRFELNNIREYTEIYGRRVFFLIDVFFFKSLKPCYNHYIIDRRLSMERRTKANYLPTVAKLLPKNQRNAASFEQLNGRTACRNRMPPDAHK